MTRSRTELTACAGIVASALAVLLILLAPAGWPTLVGALVLAAIPGGAAVLCWIDTGDGAAQAGLVLVVSLAILALASAILIWTSAWHPRLLLAVAAGCLVSCGLRLRRVEQA